MKDILSRFSWDAIRFDGQIVACAAVIWLLVVGCAISSVLNQPFNKQQRVFWITLILVFPLVGLLIYLPFSVRPENYPQLFIWRKKSY